MSLLTDLSKQAEQIQAAIDSRQESLGRDVSKAERELFLRLLDDIFSQLDFENGAIANNTGNYLLLTRLDNAFKSWQNEVMNPVMSNFVKDLFAIAEMTSIYYQDYAAEKIIQDIATSNELLRAALGIDYKGNLIKGSILADISSVPTVKQEAKALFLQSVMSNQTLKELTKTFKDFIRGKQGQNGAINTYFNSRASGYGYDLFNKVAEIKNQQFAENLGLNWFIYVGTPIKDSRQFCLDKKGKVFAVVEALNEWPTDKNLIGKGSGIPYNPLIDRGRWNCTDRIRYISEELAIKLDPKKVQQIKESYGVININE